MYKSKLKFYLHIYFEMFAQNLKSQMMYRADFFISLLGMVFTNIAGFISFWIMFRNFSSIKGWNYYEILFMYGFSLMSLTPVQCFFDNNWNLRQNVYSGDFIKYCFRPINVFFYYQAEVFDIKGLGQFAFGTGTLVYAWIKSGIGFTPLMLIKLIVFLVAASVVMVSIQNTAAAVCFWVQNSHFVLELAIRFKDYARYPITIFTPFFRFIFTFLMPIAFIAYYPSLVILRPEKVPLLSWISPLISVLFFFISYKIWMRGALNYNGTGT